MSSILAEIIANKRIEIERAQAAISLTDLKKNVALGNGLFFKSLNKQAINIVAEIKPKSPSAGQFSEKFSVDNILPIYNKYACALSVLTDIKYFAGSFSLLNEVASKTNLPILCKDFIFDPYQCYLARNNGAQAVLLIIKILNDNSLIRLNSLIKDLGMTVVMEVQNQAEFMRLLSLKLKPEIILINNRNLEDLTVNLETTKILAKIASGQATVISASGIESRQDIDNLKPFCSNFLIGSLFMRSLDLEQAFLNLIGNQVLDSLPLVEARGNI